jgi:hypothetical protein
MTDDEPSKLTRTIGEAAAEFIDGLLEKETTVTVSRETEKQLNLLTLEIQAAQKRPLSQDDIVRLALDCLERHKGEVSPTIISSHTV